METEQKWSPEFEAELAGVNGTRRRCQPLGSPEKTRKPTVRSEDDENREETMRKTKVEGEVT